MSVLIELSIFPLDQGESVGRQVGEVVRMIRASGHEHQLTAMGTLVETDDLTTALALVAQAHEVLRMAGCHRVYGTFNLDIREGQGGRLRRKVETVEAQLEASPTGTGHD